MNELQPHVDQASVQGMEQHLDRTITDMEREMLHIRYAIGRGDIGAAFRAINSVERCARDLVSVNRQTFATVEALLMALGESNSWVREFLETLQAVFPDVYELMMTATITITPND